MASKAKPSRARSRFWIASSRSLLDMTELQLRFVEPLPHEGRVAKSTIRKQRIVRDRTALLPTGSQIKPVPTFAWHGVEDKQPSVTSPRLFLDRRHQSRAHAATARGTMHQHFLD